MQGAKESAQFKRLKWTQRPRLSGYPSKRWGHTAVIHEGKLLIYGGNHSGNPKEGIYKIDCDSLEATEMQFENIPDSRESHSCNIIRDNLFIFGGCISQQLTNDLLQFKLTEPTHYWKKIQQKNPIPPRQSHVSLTLSPRNILIYGGTTPQETMLDDFWLIDIETASWLPVLNITGLLEPKIGCTMTIVNSNIYTFGGQFGQGDDSQYSNDMYKLRFDSDNFSGPSSPALTITKMNVIGNRPCPRTGHCCVDFKGRLLIIIGGEGISSKQAPVLLNDIWTFDLKSCIWTELLVQNRSNFRARSNFTANIYKNTIYIFGGFINLNGFKCTDDLVTLTLYEAKNTNTQNKSHHHQEHDSKNLKIPQQCNVCKFDFIPQGRNFELQKPEFATYHENTLVSDLSNVIVVANSIGSPFEAFGLLLHTIGQIPGQNKKQIRIKYNHVSGQNSTNGFLLSNQIVHLLNSQYISITCSDVKIEKREWQKLIYSYKYSPQELGFDLKNSLLRLGRQVLLSYLFDDDMIHMFLIASNNIYRFKFHKQSIAYQISEKKQNQVLVQFLRHYKIDPRTINNSNLQIIIASLTQISGSVSEIRDKDNGTQLECIVQNQRVIFSEFIKEYFLQDAPISIILGNKRVNLISYKRSLKNDRQIQPNTEYFKSIRLVLDEQPSLNLTSSTFVKLYFKNRRVGLYSKYPFMTGYFQLKQNPLVLNFAKTKCDSWNVRSAIQQQIQSALAQSRKRHSEVPLNKLRQEVYRSK